MAVWKVESLEETSRGNDCLVIRCPQGRYKFGRAHRLSNGDIRYRCTNRKCQVNVFVDDRGDVVRLSPQSLHNHSPLKKSQVTLLKLRTACKKYARENLGTKPMEKLIQEAYEIGEGFLPPSKHRLLMRTIQSAYKHASEQQAAGGSVDDDIRRLIGAPSKAKEPMPREPARKKPSTPAPAPQVATDEPMVSKKDLTKNKVFAVAVDYQASSWKPPKTGSPFASPPPEPQMPKPFLPITTWQVPVSTSSIVTQASVTNTPGNNNITRMVLLPGATPGTHVLAPISSLDFRVPPLAMKTSSPQSTSRSEVKNKKKESPSSSHQKEEPSTSSRSIKMELEDEEEDEEPAEVDANSADEYETHSIKQEPDSSNVNSCSNSRHGKDQGIQTDHDEDQNFLNDLLPMMKELTPGDKSMMKAQIQQLFKWKLKKKS